MSGETAAKWIGNPPTQNSVQAGNQNQCKQDRNTLGEVLLFLLDIALHPQQQGSLPLVQLAELVELEQLIGEHLLVLAFDSLEEVDEELVLSL